MNLGLVTIAAFLLLLPGVAFIIGVNFADKNVREIVFRNTPAEIGYVVFVSVFVHLLLVYLPIFNVAQLYLGYDTISGPSHGNLVLENVQKVIALSLFYILLASLVGFAPGYTLGRFVQTHAGRWTAFVKHPWMLDLLQRHGDKMVYARVVLQDCLALKEFEKNKPIMIEGLLNDSYFAADGKLLYLVFKTFDEVLDDATSESCLARLIGEPISQSANGANKLLIEGDKIAMAYYQTRPPLPLAAIEAAI